MYKLKQLLCSAANTDPPGKDPDPEKKEADPDFEAQIVAIKTQIMLFQ